LLAVDKVDVKSIGVEILLRRLGGVHSADRFGNWEICEAMAWSKSRRGLVPAMHFKAALKEANQMKKLLPGSTQDAHFPIDSTDEGRVRDDGWRRVRPSRRGRNRNAPRSQSNRTDTTATSQSSKAGPPAPNKTGAVLDK